LKFRLGLIMYAGKVVFADYAWSIWGFGGITIIGGFSKLPTVGFPANNYGMTGVFVSSEIVVLGTEVELLDALVDRVGALET